MPARSVCLVTLSLSEAGPGRFGRQVSVTDIYHTIPYHPSRVSLRPHPRSVHLSYASHPCSYLLDRMSVMTTHGQPSAASGVRRVHSTRMATVTGGPWPRAHLNSPVNTYYQARPVITMHPLGDATLGQGTFGTWHILPSISMVDSVTCLRYAECSRAPDYIINGYGYPMQTISCTWR